MTDLRKAAVLVVARAVVADDRILSKSRFHSPETCLDIWLGNVEEPDPLLRWTINELVERALREALAR